MAGELVLGSQPCEEQAEGVPRKPTANRGNNRARKHGVRQAAPFGRLSDSPPDSHGYGGDGITGSRAAGSGYGEVRGDSLNLSMASSKFFRVSRLSESPPLSHRGGDRLNLSMASGKFFASAASSNRLPTATVVAEMASLAVELLGAAPVKSVAIVSIAQTKSLVAIFTLWCLALDLASRRRNLPIVMMDVFLKKCMNAFYFSFLKPNPRPGTTARENMENKPEIWTETLNRRRKKVPETMPPGPIKSSISSRQGVLAYEDNADCIVTYKKALMGGRFLLLEEIQGQAPQELLQQQVADLCGRHWRRLTRKNLPDAIEVHGPSPPPWLWGGDSERRGG
ncbi:hypothetical protein NL676_035743 [Syzygium grande]|nr:hypothetical protein NL676_035743 [Syzygium grande]